MKKVNTLHNYFISPKGVKPPNDKSPASKPKGSKEKSTTPKREQREKGIRAKNDYFAIVVTINEIIYYVQ